MELIMMVMVKLMQLIQIVVVADNVIHLTHVVIVADALKQLVRFAENRLEYVTLLILAPDLHQLVLMILDQIPMFVIPAVLQAHQDLVNYQAQATGVLVPQLLVAPLIHILVQLMHLLLIMSGLALHGSQLLQLIAVI